MSYKAIQQHPQAHSQGLGIEFCDAEPDAIARLQDEVNTMTAALGASTLGLSLPAHGFIRQPLTAVQQQTLTQRLDLPYSEHFTGLQDSMYGLAIHENHERMVDVGARFLAEGLPTLLSERPINSHAGAHAGKPRIFFAREQLTEALVRSAQALGSIGIGLMFEDIFRPLGVQEGLFQRAIQIAQAAHPHDSAEAIMSQARSKVAFAPFFAGHKGGAAADMSLIDLRSGQRLSTGHEYLDHGACVTLDFPYVTFEEFRARQLFTHAMTMAGLGVYPGEDWHASAGDIGAALASADADNYPVVYGPIKNFDPTTGDVEPYDITEYHRQFDFVLDRILDS